MIGLIVAIPMMIRKATTEIAVTSHRLVKKTGLFSLHTEELSLNNIEGVRVDQGFWGSILGFGHLRIEGTGVDADRASRHRRSRSPSAPRSKRPKTR